LRVLGAHPRDKKPVELHAGRYGPYVKHGDTNATLPDRDTADSVTLDEALALLAAKEGKQGAAPSAGRRAVAAKARAPVSEPETTRGAATAKRAPAPAAARSRAAGAKSPDKRPARGRRTRTP
jgi:topoisomerase IA-like protein